MSRSGTDFVPRVLKLSRINFSGTVGLDNKDSVRFLALVPGCVGFNLVQLQSRINQRGQRFILYTCSTGVISDADSTLKSSSILHVSHCTECSHSKDS